MSESKSTLERINDFLIYAVAIAGILVFCLSSVPATGFAISTNGTILFVLVIVLLLFRYFSKIQIPGLLTLSKKIEEVRDEAKELRISLTQAMAKAQATSSSVINVGHFVKDNAIDAQEITNEIPQTKKSVEAQNESDKILKFVSQNDYAAAFLTIRNRIEVQLAQLVEIQTGEKSKFRNSYELLKELRGSSILSPPLIDAINLVRNTANTFVHMSPDQNRGSTAELSIIIDLAIRVISELDAQKEYLLKHKEYFIR